MSSAHEWLGRMYEDQHRFDKAAEEYEAGLNLDPRNKTLRDALKHAQANTNP
jgi:tetratricopeptide (TPR) repeat protein